jgi:hypothetical protein
MPSASSRTDAHQLVAGDDADQANQGGRRNAADTGPDREIIAALDLDQHLVTPQACHYRNRPRLASGLAFRDLHRRSKGANQKRCSFKGTKNLWRQRHRCSGSFPVHHATLARTVPGPAARCSARSRICLRLRSSFHNCEPPARCSRRTPASSKSETERTAGPC